MPNKNLVTMLVPGDVVLFYDKKIRDDWASPGEQITVLESEMFIYQGAMPQGGGDILLQFENSMHWCGMNTESFFARNCILLPKDQAPEVVQRGLSYVFAT